MKNDQPTAWQLETRLVHSGERTTDDGVQPTVMPIYATSTFVHRSAAELDRAFDENGLVYSRYSNPTTLGFEQAVAAIEGGLDAVAFASGMAALHVALLAASTPRGGTQPEPCRILAAQDLYGATHTLLQQLYAAQGWTISTCDTSDQQAVAAALADQPAIVLIEPISNPLLKMCDVPTIVAQAHDAGARVVVDNTFATPILLRPIEHGADLVVHSATKYLGGHGDVIGGVVTARTALLRDTLRRHAKLIGATLGPYEARLLARGMKTLALRVRAQSANALHVAQWLAEQPQVARVYYPGLTDHPQHTLAAALLGDQFGGMVSFDLADQTQRAAFTFMDALRLILPATTLGDVFSLVSYSARSSHRDMTPTQRQALGIGDGLLRLSIGIEAVDDIVADLQRGLAASATPN